MSVKRRRGGGENFFYTLTALFIQFGQIKSLHNKVHMLIIDEGVSIIYLYIYHIYLKKKYWVEFTFNFKPTVFFYTNVKRKM